jgi:hypothetical protein
MSDFSKAMAAYTWNEMTDIFLGMVQQTEMAGYLSGCIRNVFLIGVFHTTARLRP